MYCMHFIMNIPMFHPSSTSPYTVDLESDNKYVNYHKRPTLCISRGPVTDSNFSGSGPPNSSVDYCPQLKGVVEWHNLEMYPLALIVILDMFLLHSTNSLSISVFPSVEVWEGDTITIECEAGGEVGVIWGRRNCLLMINRFLLMMKEFKWKKKLNKLTQFRGCW